MIQRIQSIYLFLAALFMGGTISNLFDIGKTTSTSEGSDLALMMADGHIDILDNQIWTGLTGAVVLLSLIALFMFKNRNLQMNISRLNILLMVGTMGAIMFVIYPSFSKDLFQFGFDIALQGMAVIFTYLGINSIKKDTKLVKSMDRLR